MNTMRPTTLGPTTMQPTSAMRPSRIALWLVLALFAFLFAKELPDLRRYLRIRSM